jgi:LacI family xylobiose transport system transcriptional regulator
VTDPGTRVTLAVIAEEAEVSLSTISKVLNGRADVSAATRRRVEELLEQNGYRRRKALPKAPVKGGYLELVFPELESTWSVEIIRGVEDVARLRGLSVILSESGGRLAPPAAWLDGAIRRQPAAIVLVVSTVPPFYSEILQSRSIPFIVIDPAGDPPPDVPSVGSANWSGGLAATRHLVKLGHTRIAAITGPADMRSSQVRLDGYRSAMFGASLPVHPEWTRYGDFTPAAGLKHGRELLELDDDAPTAIFAGNDLQALGVLQAIRSLGLRAPDDVSVVGYDDIPLADWSTPRLTTVHQPLRQMAQEATRLVTEPQIAGYDAVPRLDLSTHLVIRESTAPPSPEALAADALRAESLRTDDTPDPELNP